MRHTRIESIPARAEVRQAIAEFARTVRAAAGGQASEIVLYGSHARGEGGSESDVDLLVRWKGNEAAGRSLIGLLAGEIFVRTGVLLAPHVVGPEHWAKWVEIDSMFLANVEREGIVVEG